MNPTPARAAVDEPWTIAGNLDAHVAETHTGVVMLLGAKAYKAKKPVTTDFLDFSTVENRERACEHEVTLNRRLAPDSYLGVAHFTDAQGGPPEPVIVMRRYPNSIRLTTLVRNGEPVREHLAGIAETLARFHRSTTRNSTIDEHGTPSAVSARWQQNLDELKRYTDTVLSGEAVTEVARLANRFIAGRSELFARRIEDGRLLDGHADLLADDIFCMPDGPAMLDCLEFDDHLRYVDGADDAAFLAMDLEYLGREDLGGFFLSEYCRFADDAVLRSLTDFYIAYRAVVRAKVDCVRVTQGHREAAAQAQRHLDIALGHLRSGAVRLVMVGGGPGTGKTTLAHALGRGLDAAVLSTDDIRRELQETGVITGTAGQLDTGLYAPANVAAVYDEVLRRARGLLAGGRSVILDGTWRDAAQRMRAHALADDTYTPMVEFTCTASLEQASRRIQTRSKSTSDATPEIAAALAESRGASGGYQIDTSRPLAESVAEAEQLCRLVV